MTNIIKSPAQTVSASLANDWENKIDLIKSTVAVGATDAELQLFLHQCKKTGLDPLAKQIYFQKYNDKKGTSKMTIIIGIDGYRSIAERSGEYAGNDDPVFDNELSPTKATVTVYRIVRGVRCPFTASARWDQYYPGDQKGFMWKKMPHMMLGKVAESLALRKAFPADLSGTYTAEEMEQATKEGAPSHEQKKEILQTTLEKIERSFASLGISRGDLETRQGEVFENFDERDVESIRAYYLEVSQRTRNPIPTTKYTGPENEVPKSQAPVIDKLEFTNGDYTLKIGNYFGRHLWKVKAEDLEKELSYLKSQPPGNELRDEAIEKIEHYLYEVRS